MKKLQPKPLKAAKAASLVQKTLKHKVIKLNKQKTVKLTQ